ncbi:hypothetical protein [Pseudarthrobacter sp. N5]|uniref:hypothetical protein n=1 Tax=Pseudarthrobacter sp. N5 TaxID=3418416 RepID=UPI003CF002D3
MTLNINDRNGKVMKDMGIRSALLVCTLTARLWKSASVLTFGPQRPSGSEDPERGDVPGWVMITLMSAVLVAALLALAGPALETMFNQAMDKVGK